MLVAFLAGFQRCARRTVSRQSPAARTRHSAISGRCIPRRSPVGLRRFFKMNVPFIVFNPS
jgi:hypothetical protein